MDKNSNALDRYIKTAITYSLMSNIVFQTSNNLNKPSANHVPLGKCINSYRKCFQNKHFSAVIKYLYTLLM